MAKPRTASAIFVSRIHQGEREVLLVHRSPKLRFFGGYLAFPGGTIDPIDRELGESGEENALCLAAVRELFEETGYLPSALRQSLAPEEVREVREALLEKTPRTDGWASWVRAQPDVANAAKPFCRITTPEFAPVRYATLFAHVEAPPEFEPEIWEGELIDGAFWKPGEALRAWREGKISIVPPVLFLLQELEKSQSVPEFLDRAAQKTEKIEAGSLHPIYFTPGIFVAPLKAKTKPPATTTNCFIAGEKRKIIIDPGSPFEDENQKLFEKIDELTGDGDSLDALVLTHHHPDHTGGVDALLKRFPMPVWAHPETLSRITLPEGTETRALEEGDKIVLGNSPDGQEGWHFEVWHTPGHAPGHIALIDSRYRSAIVGDLLSIVSTIVIDPSEGHMTTYLNSLRRLIANDSKGPVGMVHPAHGPCWLDGEGLVKSFLSHRKAREDSLYDALERNRPKTEKELTELIYADTDPRAHPLAQRSLLAGLIKLEEDGRARRSEEGWSSL